MKYQITPPIDKINIPEDFKIACWIGNLDYVDVLQNFINYVTMFDLYWKGSTENFSEVACTLLQFSKDKNKEDIGLVVSDFDHAIQDYHTQSFTNLVNCSQEEGEENREQSYEHVTELLDMARRKFARKTLFKLSAESELVLSDDFCMFCEMYQAHPAEILEYFMSKISMAERDAKIGLKLPDDNQTMIFFRRLASQANSTFENVYLTEVEEESDTTPTMVYQKRTAKLKKIYQQHYKMAHAVVS